jgi:hypothetical protein
MTGRATPAVGAETLEEGVAEVDLPVPVGVVRFRNAVGIGERKEIGQFDLRAGWDGDRKSAGCNRKRANVER